MWPGSRKTWQSENIDHPPYPDPLCFSLEPGGMMPADIWTSTFPMNAHFNNQPIWLKSVLQSQTISSLIHTEVGQMWWVMTIHYNIEWYMQAKIYQCVTSEHSRFVIRIRACYKVADVPLSMTAYIHTKLSKSKWGLTKIRPQTPGL
jgi:hypothetical protein